MGKGDRTDRAARIIQWREGVSYDGWASARALQNIAATVRPDLLSQGSYVAPSPQRRIPCKRHETELTCCPVYDFKPRAIYTKGLTPALLLKTVNQSRHKPKPANHWQESISAVNNWGGKPFSAALLRAALLRQQA